ncbi:hypothetical protein MMC31_001563 [Peltigera leucophlebia]|nr:hypothetical protein [Peltigera leucophlebia]
MASPTRPLSPLSPRHLNLGTPRTIERETSSKVSVGQSDPFFEDTENLAVHNDDSPQSPSDVQFASLAAKITGPTKIQSPKKRTVTYRATSPTPPEDTLLDIEDVAPVQIMEASCGEASIYVDLTSTTGSTQEFENTQRVTEGPLDGQLISSTEDILFEKESASQPERTEDGNAKFVAHDETASTILIPSVDNDQRLPDKGSEDQDSSSPVEALTQAIQNLEDESIGSYEHSTDNDMSVIETPQENNLQSPKKRLGINQPTALTEDSLRENEGLTRAFEMFEDENSRSIEQNADDETTFTIGGFQGCEGMDDTGFTNFSVVPATDVTLRQQIEPSTPRSRFNSPEKDSDRLQYGGETRTPRRPARNTPGSARHRYDQCSPSPTPRRPEIRHATEAPELIPDFTEQLYALAKGPRFSPSRSQRSPRKFDTQPDLLAYTSDRRSPTRRPSTPPERRHYASLLDFDLTPAPTPRSVPSITARELESLKSSFLSQISSLRATVTGKDAEVSSLKDAVADAERRVGKALEEIREERGLKESLQAGKIDWEKRDKEMQSVLRSVKEQIIHGDREMDHLQQKLEESERKREEAEGKLIEAQTKIAGMKAGSAAANLDGTPGSNTNRSTDAAIEKVAKELHTLYKQKHELKVGALKESYRARWERKTRELESRIDQLTRENDDLRLGRDATMSGVVPPSLHSNAISQEKLDQERAEQAKRTEEKTRALAALQDELTRVRRDNANLMAKLDKGRADLAGVKDENGDLAGQLEKYRLEMADLVAATEEMMQLSLNAASSVSNDVNPSQMVTKASMENLRGSVENLRGSVSRAASGLKPPGHAAGLGESRIGRGRGGFGAPVVGSSTRSGIMGNIERMGRGRMGD